MSRKDVLDAKQSIHVNYHDVERIQGAGSFFGDFRRFFKKVGRDVAEGIKKYGPSAMRSIRDDVIPTVKAVAPLLPMLGLGEGEAEAEADGEGYYGAEGNALVGGRMRRRNPMKKQKRRAGVLVDEYGGEALVGGELMSRDLLRQRLMNR